MTRSRRSGGTLGVLMAIGAGLAAGAGAQAVVLVEEGVPRAIVVLPDDPSPAQEFAAQELVYHVRRATGAELPSFRESEAPADAAFRVYVGPCRATAEARIDTESLPPSGHVVRTSGNALFLAGRDRERGPRDGPLTRWIGNRWAASWQGTLYAVYDFLENEMGVRWLFPGELGEEIPARTDLSVDPVDRAGEPRFRMAWWNPAGAKLNHRPGWSTPEAHAAYHEAQKLFLVRHRFGAVEHLAYGHAFQRYWQRFGESNPEFFNELPDGTRRPLEGRPNGHDITLCVSNAGLRSRIIADWRGSRERDPENIPHRPYVNACENDTPGMCACAACRAWDAPDPGFESHDYWGRGIIPHNSRRFTLARTPWGELAEGDDVAHDPPSLSDRYARFYMELVREAREIDPEARVAGYAYANYWKAPLNPQGDLDLDGVTIPYVPPIGFPYTEQMSREFRANWEGWSRLGAEMILRPNLTHDGANLPIFYARQIAADFSFAAEHGMIGTAFDSLLGAWSAQGPTKYVLTRLHQHPDWPVDRILDEYYAAFGPAESGVRAYFGYWERHSDALDPVEVRQWKAEEQGGGFKNYVRIAHRLFHPEHFSEARALLEGARRQAAGDARALRRIAYLEQGLADAELTAATRAAQARTEQEDSEANRSAFEAAFGRLLDYRAAMEASDLHAADIGYFAYREQSGSRWPHLRMPAPGEMAQETAFQARWPDTDSPQPTADQLRWLSAQHPLPRTGWRFRKDPERRGDLLGWHRPETGTDDWQEVAIEAAWASFLGEPYVGAGWYRRAVEVPALAENASVFLHFGGVDESCWVWINGEYAGRHHIGPHGWDVSFRLDATRFLRPGANDLVVRVMNTAAAGGIWRPVRLEVYDEAE